MYIRCVMRDQKKCMRETNGIKTTRLKVIATLLRKRKEGRGRKKRKRRAQTLSQP